MQLDGKVDVLNPRRRWYGPRQPMREHRGRYMPMSGLGDAPPSDQPPITAADQTAWYNVIGQFENYAAQFQTSYADMVQQADFISTQSQDVQDEYQALLQRFANTQSDITTVQAGLNDIKNALAGAWSVVTGVWANVSGNLKTVSTGVWGSIKSFIGLSGEDDGLGFLPLIPIAIVAAAITALALILSDYATFSQKVALLKQYVAQGLPPDQAAAAVNSALGPSPSTITSTLGTLVWVAAGIAAIVFLPKLISSYKALK